MIYNNNIRSLFIAAGLASGYCLDAAVAAPVLWGPNMAVRTAQANFKAQVPQYINPVVAGLNNAVTQIRSGQPIASALGALTFPAVPAGAVATNDASLKDMGLGGPITAALNNLAVAMQSNPNAVLAAKPTIATFVQNLVNFLPAFVVPNSDVSIANPINLMAQLAGVALPYKGSAAPVTAQQVSQVGGVVGQPVIGTVASIPAQAQGVAGNAQLGSQAMAIMGIATNALTAAVTAMNSTTKTTNASDVLKILQGLNDKNTALGNQLTPSLNLNPADPNFPSVLTLLGTITSLFATMDKRCYSGTKSISPTMVTSPFLDASNLQAIRAEMTTLVTVTVPRVLGLVTNPAPTNLAAVQGYTATINQLVATVNSFKTNDAAAPMITMAVKALSLFTDRIGDRTPTVLASGIDGISRGGITNAEDLKKALVEINTTTTFVLGNKKIASLNMATPPNLTPLFAQLAKLQTALTQKTTVVKATGLATLTQMNTIYLNPGDLQAVKTGLAALATTIQTFVQMLTPNVQTAQGYQQGMAAFSSFIASFQASAGAGQQASGSMITTATKTIDKVSSSLGSLTGITNAKKLITAMNGLNNTSNIFGCGSTAGSMSATALPDMTAFTNSVNKFLAALKKNTSNVPQGTFSTTAYLTPDQIQQVGKAIIQLGNTTIPAFMGLMIQAPKNNPYYAQIRSAINTFLQGSIFAAAGQITN